MPSRVYSLDGLERTRLTSAACMPACAGLVVDPLPPPHEDDARLSSARRLRQGAGSRSAESGRVVVVRYGRPVAALVPLDRLAPHELSALERVKLPGGKPE